MAVSIEAAFVLIDRASGPLKKIQRQAEMTDKALRGVGGSSGGGVPGWTRQYTTYGKAVGDVTKTTKQLGDETEKTAKKVEKSVGWFERATKSVKAYVGQLSKSHPVFTAFSTTLGGVVGGLKGMVTALPLMATAALAAAPAIVALVGSVGALVSSLGFAVGGGGLLGAGLLGSFAVGLGSIAAVAKPALDGLKKYQAGVTALNKAIASGSPTAIKTRQKELDAIAKANPGVAQLAGNLKKFQGEWKKATTPARASFFKLAADGIQSLRKLIPTLSREANLNTAALQESFQKILAPFLDSSQFKGFISGLGGIFRANLPGFITGLVNVFKGLADILKVLTPQLDKAGPSFAKFTSKFAKWAASAGGQSTIKEMGRAFTAWLDLVKQIARIIGSVAGAGAGPGTNQIGKWADKMQGFADTLSKPADKKSLGGFFQRSLDDVDKLWPVLKQVATDLTGIYKVWKPLGSIVQTVVKAVPAWVIAAGSLAWVGGKGAVGAFQGAKSVFGLFSSKNDGSTEAKSLWVRMRGAWSGGGGGGGSKGKLSAEEKAVAESSGLTKLVKKSSTGAKLLEKFPKLATGVEAVGKAVPGVGTAIALAFGTAGFLSASGPMKAKIQAAIEAADPTSVLNLFGAPSASQILFGLKGGNVKPSINQGGPKGNPRFFPQSLAQPPPKSGYFDTPTGRAPYKAPTGDLALKSFVADVQTGLSGNVGLQGFVANVQAGLAALTADQKPKLNKNLVKPVTAATKQVAADFTTMNLTTSGAMVDLQDTVSTNTNLAYQIGSANFKKLSQDIATYVASGGTATAAGLANITAQVNAALKGLGSKTVLTPLSVKALSPQNLAAVSTGQVSPGAALAGTSQGGGHAGGGLIQIGRPGAAGHDTVRMNAGGVPITVGEGEQVAVFNRHQQPIINSALASKGYAGLPGLFNKVNTPNYMASGGVVGEVNDFFTSAGFDRIAIAGILGNAMQESSLNPNAPGGGMWQQISNFGQGTGGSLLNQMQVMLSQIGGIRAALNAAGSPGAAATIFEQSFERAGIPALASRIRYAQEAYTGGLGAGLTGGAGVPMLVVPTVTGAGPMVPIVRGGLSSTVAAANAYMTAHGAGFGGGAVPAGAAGTVVDPSGKLVAGWIEPILAWARQHGWSGSVTSGYRSYAQQAAIYNSGVRPAAVPGTSNHEGTVYPRGAVDVSDASQLSAVLSRSPYASTLVWAGSKDPVHFSHPHGGSYARGGMVPWFAHGADFVANRPTVIGVGDAPGGERVTVTPKGAAGPGGVHIEIHKIEVHRKGDIQKIVDEELQLLAASIAST